MNKIITAILSLALFTTSCSKDFFDVGEEKTVKNIEGTMKSLYYDFASPTFFGRNIIGLGDLATDNVSAKTSGNDLSSFYTYNVREDNRVLLEIWMSGYRIYHKSTCLISDIEDMKVGASNSDVLKLTSVEAQAYSMRALTNFNMVNVFGFPYSAITKSGPGLVVVRNCENADGFRSSLDKTYESINKDIEKAIELFEESNTSLTPFSMNETAILALKARVQMKMEDYKGVVETTQKIMDGSNMLVGNESAYFDMWGSTTLNFEDIFVIGSDYQNYNYSTSLNTLYGAFGTKISPSLISIFAENDYRLNVINFKTKQGQPAKFRGGIAKPNNYNVPVFRLSEIYLLSAEAKAHLGDATGIDDLFEIAKRNIDLKKGDIPTSGQALLDFISEERRRELYQEGHRWVDMRRTGEIMTRPDLDNGNFDVQKFVYPVPLYEINASGIEQNDWLPGMPNQN